MAMVSAQWGEKIHMQGSLLSGWMNRLCTAILLAGMFQSASAQVDDPPPVPVVPTSEYRNFLDQFRYSIRVDTFYFLKNFPEFKDKQIMIDARYWKQVAPGIVFVKMWRNYGILPMIITDIPAGKEIPQKSPFLVAGTMVDYKNEVVDGELLSMPVIKFQGVYKCEDFRCNQ